MNRTVIIAEAGVNHNGSIDLAFELIDRASESGADYVKFQSFTASSLVTKAAARAVYQEKNQAGTSESQYQMLKRLELTPEDHDKLIAHCDLRNIRFLSTPFNTEMIGLLQSKGVRIGKIASGEITNLPYLRQMAKAFPEIILSTGMSTLAEVRQAMDVLLENGLQKEALTVLQCNTEYPTPMEDVNLLAMLTMKRELGVNIGYSDHTAGIEVPVAAVALGARLIEKHFTTDRNLEGPDHKASLEPGELKEMVRSIRNIELALGSGIKAPSPSEQKNIAVARKSLVAARTLPAGTIIRLADIAVKRPGSGISPMKIETFIGRRLIRNLEEETLFTESDFE